MVLHRPILEYNNKVLIILPGPPRELQPMFEEHVIPYLENRSSEKIVSKVLKIYGIGESDMEEKLRTCSLTKTILLKLL